MNLTESLNEAELTLRRLMDSHASTDGDSSDDVGDAIEVVLAVLKPCNGWSNPGGCKCDHCAFIEMAHSRAGLKIKSLPPVEGSTALTQAEDDILSWLYNWPTPLDEPPLSDNPRIVEKLEWDGLIRIGDGFAIITEAGIKAGKYAPR